MHHVLLSNDDGVNAAGLRALADAFLADGWRVSVCAPDRERSAAAHSITIKRPLAVSPLEWEGVPTGVPLKVWKVDGTPADCVKLALLELLPQKPDVVVSGINNGWNIGTDVHYSGTVGAAMEAAFEGVPAIAVSVERPDAARFRYTAQYALKSAAGLLVHPAPMRTVLNLNAPNCAPEQIRGIVEAPLTPIQYTDSYDRMEHTRGRSAYWLKGEIIERGCLPGGDLDRLLHGYATMTLMGWDVSILGGCEGFLQDV